MRLAFIVLFALSPAIAAADERKEAAIHCLEAVTSGDFVTAAQVAEGIKSWSYEFNFETVRLGEQCLNSALGEEWLYSSVAGKMVTRTAAAAMTEESVENSSLREQQEAAARVERVTQLEREADARFELERRILAACRTLFLRDEVEALTNEVCVPVFRVTGLPD
ncbi:hypothetical protein [Frigidibacter oleivorans]|uniref:hypothetical protein n=1 Tax=Frigidibacter oleivorans TaxID=2487129 RepID=UPI000F8E1FF4|nr:hypothetical protein [Frigidibacter oleivorans]